MKYQLVEDLVILSAQNIRRCCFYCLAERLPHRTEAAGIFQCLWKIAKDHGWSEDQLLENMVIALQISWMSVNS